MVVCRKTFNIDAPHKQPVTYSANGVTPWSLYCIRQMLSNLTQRISIYACRQLFF